MLDSHVIGRSRSPGRQGPRSGPSPRAESNNMIIQHILISKLDFYYDRPTCRPINNLINLNSFKVSSLTLLIYSDTDTSTTQ